MRGSAWLLLVVLASAPAAAVPVPLYIHLADPANMDAIPMNALPPPEGFAFRGPAAATAMTLTCLGGGTQHTVYAIQYAAPTDDTVQPQSTRGELRGLAYATELAGVGLRWFVETVAPTGGDPAASPVPLGNVVVRATLREGEDVAGPETYEKGAILAQGSSPPAVLAGNATSGATHATVDGRHVYGFDVPLAVVKATLPERGFNLRVDVAVENPACGGASGQAMVPLVALHSSPGLRPVLQAEVAEPVRIVSTNATQTAGGTVHLRVEALTVWGGYATGNVSITAAGPSPVGNATLTTVLPRPDDPNMRPPSPAYAFWSWPAGRERAAAGSYDVSGMVEDVAGNAVRFANVTVALHESETHPPPATNPAPALPVGLLIVPLALGAALRRRP